MLRQNPRKAWKQLFKMAATTLHNLVSYLSRRITRNTICKGILTDKNMSPRLLGFHSSRFFSEDGKNTEKGVDSQVQEDNDQKIEGPTEEDPYAPFPDDINPITGERGGPKGPEPTRYGDWERKGRCIDF